MRRSYLFIVILSIFLLLLAEPIFAVSCCKNDGTELFTYSSQEQCMDNCSRQSGLTGMSITCMPSCNILNAESCSTLGGQCIEAENGVCPTGRSPIAGRCERYDTQACCGPAPAAPEFDIKVPKLQIPLFTMKPFTIPFRVETPEGGSAVVINFIANYIEGIYRFAVGIAGILAAIMIIWAGMTWLTAAGNPEKIGGAKKRLASAAMGLILVLGSYVILYVINPDLVFLKPLRIETIQRVILTLEDQEEEFAEISEGGQVVTGNVCNNIEDCRKICNQPVEEWPTRGAATPPLETLKPVRNIAGLDGGCPDGCVLSPTALTMLERAAQIAQTAPGGPYTLQVTSAYRPLRKQIQFVCDKIALVDKGQYDPTKLGTALGWPGNPKSGHGLGQAVDIALRDKDGQVVSCSGRFDSQKESRWKNGAKKLFDIMTQAGFTRYCREIWHFELPSSVACRSSRIPADKINTISCSAEVCPP